ncbi:TVP38/TMEM64 family protein [Haloimpatiens sp. FM7330]|uniref:TVP38/TMEM64 family protein n=1 Tax=Haloimpatiens sp. FM7330 TaxID=3298610 RepID=UPI003633ECB8
MKKKLTIRDILCILIVSIIVLFIFIHRHQLRHINIHRVIRYINRSGELAFCSFIAIYALKPIVLVIPSAMLSVVGGVIFGPIKGFVFNMIGFFLSGTLAFFLSRFLGRSFVERILKGKMLKLDSSIEKNGFKIIFFLRLPPILPFDPLSYTCGLTKIKYRDFMIGSLLGVIPETICYSYMGCDLLRKPSIKIVIPIIIVASITMTISCIFNKRKKTYITKKTEMKDSQ